MTAKEKAQLPEDVKSKMNLWRQGFIGMPREYIDFHLNLARPALDALTKEHNLTVHKTWEQSDGWLDGMRVLYAIVEERSGRLVKLSWHDGNQEFFEHKVGSFPYRPNPKS